jgi:molybdopterin-guanine dinucleotide biosynthesis protein
MRYINNRNTFIKKWKEDINISESFDMSGSGPLGNEIAWGDSLIGRLINSTIRVAKIKYDAKKVNTLLNDFKAQLDLILVESLSRDDRSEFFILQLKGFLNQVDNVCTSTKDEKEKLEDLLGSSDGNSLWNPKNPMRGKWDDIVKDGLLRTIHDRIEFDFNEEIIKVAGPNKEDITNSISDLIDELREYAYVLDNPGATPTPRKTFPVRFYGLLKKYKNRFMKVNTSFKLKGYLQFIKETEEKIKPVDESIEKKANLVFVENFKTIADIYMMYDKQKAYRKAYKPTKKEDISKLSAEELKAKLNDPAYSKEKEKIQELILQKEKGNNESIDYSFLLENKSNPILTSIKSLYNVIRSEGG